MPKKIIDNFEKFIQDLLNFMQEDISRGKGNLLKIITEAKTSYEREIHRWVSITGWAKWLLATRQRSKDFDDLINFIKNESQVLPILQKFSIFLNEGTWNDNSANTQLINLFAAELKEYKAVKDPLVRRKIYHATARKLTNKVNELVKIEADEKKRKDERYQELQRMSSSLNDVSNVLVLANTSSVQEIAKEDPSVYCFVLNKVGKGWQLTWYDATGNNKILLISDELKKILATVDDLSTVPARKQVEIKKACRNMVIEELDMKIKIQINPAKPALDLGFESTYVINTKDMSVTWYDSFSKAMVLDITNNDRLLNLIKDPSTLKETLKQVQVELYNLNKRRPVNASSQENIKKHMNKDKGFTLITANDISTIKPYLLVPGVYILTKEEGNWALYLRRKGKINERVDDSILQEGKEGFAALVKKCNVALPEQISAVNKDRLRKQLSYIDLAMQQKNLNLEDMAAIAERQLKEQALLANEDLNKESIAEEKLKQEAALYPCCKAVENFLPENSPKYPAFSFVVTQADERWQLYYIDTLNRAVAVNLDQCAFAAKVIASWKALTPATLLPTHLLDLAKTLNGFKPSKPISTGVKLFLQEMLSQRMEKAQQKDVPASVQDEISAKPESKKLDLKRFSAVTQLFGAMEKPQVEEPFIEELPFTKCEISPPTSRRTSEKEEELRDPTSLLEGYFDIATIADELTNRATTQQMK